MNAFEVKAALVGVAALAAFVLARRVGGAAARAADAINPLNHDNVFAKGVNALGGAIFTAPTDAGVNADGSWSLGGAAYDWLNPSTAQAVRDLSAGSGGAAAAPDPWSQQILDITANMGQMP